MISGSEPDRVAACHCCCQFAGRKLLLVPTANDPGDRRWLFGYSWAAGGHVGSGTAGRKIFPGRLLFSGCGARVKNRLTVTLL
jgi:hypothetical protein